MSSAFAAALPGNNEKLRQALIDPSHMLYVAYFLTAPLFHNDARIVHALYRKIIDFAKEQGKRQLCFMEDVSAFDHPFKPSKKINIESWHEVLLDVSI